jgi:2-dehydropantoate 2-reductase
MRVLVVGAGAVGQVYGHHLAKGGAEVTYFVKPRHAQACARGLTLYALGDTTPLHVASPALATAVDEIAGTAWDQVWLAVASPALHEGTWLREVCRATGDATVVSLPPNLADRPAVLAAAADARVVDGIIGFLAYAAPLPGETRFAAPGIAWWSPPLSPSRFSGPRHRVREVVAALRRGGLPAAPHRDVPGLLPYVNAALYAYLAVLELTGWSLATLAGTRCLARAHAVAREAMRACAATREQSVPARMLLGAHRWVVRAGLWFAPRLVPLPLEAYLRAHFTKIGPQLRMGLRESIACADAARHPARELRALVAALPPSAMP